MYDCDMKQQLSKSFSMDKFILSPILSFRENQDKLNAIIENEEVEDQEEYIINELDELENEKENNGEKD